MQQVSVPSGTIGTFTAVVSLKTPEQVQQLTAALKRIVDKSTSLMDDLARDASSWRPLLQDIILMIKLCWEFVEVCLEPEGKRRSSDLLTKMDEDKRRLAQHCLGVQQSPSGLTHELRNGIVVEVQNLLIGMANLTDEMELDQVFRIKRSAKYAFGQMMVLKDTSSTYLLDNKLADAQSAWDHLLSVLSNRTGVIADSPIKEQLLNVQEVVTFHGKALCEATKQYAHNLDGASQAQRAESLQELAAAVQFILDHIDETLTKAACSFQEDVINAKLAAFETAVQHGSTSEAAANAKYLIDELNKLKGQAGNLNESDADSSDSLGESCDKLKLMTKKLLEAAKNAMANKEGGEAALQDTLADVKGQVAQVAQIEQVVLPQKKNNSALKQSLLKAAKDMGTGMEAFVVVLTPPSSRRKE